MIFKGGNKMEYLVFDVGGTAIKYALMNDELEMLEKGSVSMNSIRM